MLEGKIKEICDTLCHKELKQQEQLIHSGVLDSFLLMELICTLEEEFQITFQPDEIEELDHFSCVQNITEIVRRKTTE